MSQITSFVICFPMGALRSRLCLQLGVAALRHQLSVYQGTPRRPAISSGDRLLWSIIASMWSGLRKALFFVQPRTVIAWQHKRFRDRWRGLSGGGCRGRRSIPPELRRLIRQMWQANPIWGSPRIVGELQKLGIDIAKSTVEKYRPKLRGPTSRSWTMFLKQHIQDIVAIDLFIVPTARLRVLFVLIVLAHDRRRLVYFNVTEDPTSEWTAQQLVEAFPWEPAPKYLLRDRDAVYGSRFRNRVRGLRMKERVIAPRSPCQNPYAERIIGSIRRECLDHVVVFNERHFKRLLRKYFSSYHRWRPHRSLEKDSPDGRPVHSPEPGEVIEFPAVHGLHHYYLRHAAWIFGTHNGRICLNNNAAELALRGIALGRKSWLFAGSDRGGQRAAVMYTLIVTAKMNDVDPQAWLADVLARIADRPFQRLDELLTWNWEGAATAGKLVA